MEQPEQEVEKSPGTLIQAIYAGAKAIDEDNPEYASILKSMARLLNDSNIQDIDTLEEVIKV